MNPTADDSPIGILRLMIRPEESYGWWFVQRNPTADDSPRGILRLMIRPEKSYGWWFV